MLYLGANTYLPTSYSNRQGGKTNDIFSTSTLGSRINIRLTRIPSHQTMAGSSFPRRKRRTRTTYKEPAPPYFTTAASRGGGDGDSCHKGNILVRFRPTVLAQEARGVEYIRIARQTLPLRHPRVEMDERYSAVLILFSGHVTVTKTPDFR